MTGRTQDAFPFDREDMRARLEQALGETMAGPIHLSRLVHRAMDSRTSFPLEELTVELDDGRHFAMLCKNESRRYLTPEARNAKPAFLHNPLREIEIYRHVLARHALGTPVFYGAITSTHSKGYWLFLERVPGAELFQVGDFHIWEEVSRWLAGMHAELGEQHAAICESVPLLVYNSTYFRRWIERARKFTAGAELETMIRALWRRYDRVIDRLLALGRMLLHGEFYASNVLVVQASYGLRVAPVDWEMAAIGPGLIDLAALVAGNWSEEQKQALARAYYLAMPDSRKWPWPDFKEALDYCRLHIAVQWLGWSRGWSPPKDHAYDWGREATLLAEKLGLC